MPNSWMTALKQWNSRAEHTGNFCVPRKGSKGYDEVRALQGKAPLQTVKKEAAPPVATQKKKIMIKIPARKKKKIMIRIPARPKKKE